MNLQDGVNLSDELHTDWESGLSDRAAELGPSARVRNRHNVEEDS